MEGTEKEKDDVVEGREVIRMHDHCRTEYYEHPSERQKIIEEIKQYSACVIPAGVEDEYADGYVAGYNAAVEQIVQELADATK